MIRRKTPLSRGAPPTRKTPPKKRNAKRTAKNFERSYGAKAEWIRQQPCHFCARRRNIEAAHVITGGMGRKADARFLIPMCGPWSNSQGCHRLVHQVGWATFLRENKDPFMRGAYVMIEENEGVVAWVRMVADTYEERWQAHVVAGGGDTP